jgi:hypothetical protein
VTPWTYDYIRAARDALHFGKLLDRWCQNLRRVAGYDVQYFATVEPQRRGAPHAHFAIRGTPPRALVRELTAATYAQVWWPAVDAPVYVDRLPEWDPAVHSDKGTGHDRLIGGYVDPDSRRPLPTWDEALDDLAEQKDARPHHVVRFGTQLDVKGVLAGSPEAERCIGYLVKYLVKDLGDDLNPNNPHDDEYEDLDDEPLSLSRADAKAAAARRADHIARLAEALRFEPCSPRCANWLRYGVQPKNPRLGLRPGCCRAKAHRPSHLGYGGRRVLVSRKWTAKDLADPRLDRRAHVLAVLGRTPDGQPATRTSGTSSPGQSSATGPAPDDDGVVWELAKNNDPDVAPLQRRILRNIAHATRWRAEYRTARDCTKTHDDGVAPVAPLVRDDKNGRVSA